MVPTFLTNLALGVLTSMVATIMSSSAWVPGSQIIQGNQFFDTTNNPNPGVYVNTVKVLAFTGSVSSINALVFDSSNGQPLCTKYGANFIDCYQRAVFTNTGGSVGAGTYYNVASITKPYAGSGSIRDVLVTCANSQGKATNVSVDQVTLTTNSGTGIFNKKAIGSGAYMSYGSGGVMWRKDKPFIKASTSTTAGIHQACQLEVWSSGFYTP